MLMIQGITLFAAITGTITSRLVLRDEGRTAGAEIPDLLRELASLRSGDNRSDAEHDAKKAELLERL